MVLFSWSACIKYEKQKGPDSSILCFENQMSHAFANCFEELQSED